MFSFGAWDSIGMTETVNRSNTECPCRIRIPVTEKELPAIFEIWRPQKDWNAIRVSSYICAEDAYQKLGYPGEPKHRKIRSEDSPGPHVNFGFVDGFSESEVGVPATGINVTDADAQALSITTTARARNSTVVHACRFFFRDYYAG